MYATEKKDQRVESQSGPEFLIIKRRLGIVICNDKNEKSNLTINEYKVYHKP